MQSYKLRNVWKLPELRASLCGCYVFFLLCVCVSAVRASKTLPRFHFQDSVYVGSVVQVVVPWAFDHDQLASSTTSKRQTHSHQFPSWTKRTLWSENDVLALLQPPLRKCVIQVFFCPAIWITWFGWHEPPFGTNHHPLTPWWMN